MNSQTKERIMQYPNFRQCSIQTFNDQNKDEKSQSRILPMTDENLEKCEKLQEMLPYGIYFSVNPMESGMRNKESVKFIQTWICDIDSWTKEEQKELIDKAELKPTFVVESVHWFHLYYLADKHLTQEEFEEWNFGLRDYYNGDVKVCKDSARVLRIPWYYHCKGDKVMVEWRKDLSSWALYSVDEMKKAFPKKEIEQPKVEIKPIENKRDVSDSYWERVSSLDNRQMLLELSGTRWMNGEIISFKTNGDWTEQIRVNGKSTSCWIDKVWMIGSYDKWWPTWIQRLEYYLNRKFTKSEWGELAKRIDTNHPELRKFKNEKPNTKELIYKPNRVPKLTKPDFTRWSKWFDSAIGKMKKWQLVILLWETWAWKTTFATFIARNNKWCCYYVLEDSVENIASRYAMRQARITIDQYNEWTWTEEQEINYETAYKNFRNRDLNLIDIWHKWEVDKLIESIKEMKNEWCSLFFIDNLWFIIGEWRTEAEQTADVSSKLVSLCIQENICIVLLHHFKKKGSPLDRRDISQMRWSWKIGDDAFTVLEYLRDDEQTFLQVYKDRTWGNLKLYEIAYDRGDFVFIGEYWK